MSDNFARDISKIIVAQICKEIGFQSIQEGALETLCDILQKCEFLFNLVVFLTLFPRYRRNWIQSSLEDRACL